MLNQRNTTAQGTVGLSASIALYSSRGWSVSLPLVDEQPYDMLAHNRITDKINKVQVKTTRCVRASGNYSVSLKGAKPFDRTEVDILFVLTALGDIYEIPSEEVGGTSQIVLGPKYSQYKVTRFTMPRNDIKNVIAGDPLKPIKTLFE